MGHNYCLKCADHCHENRDYCDHCILALEYEMELMLIDENDRLNEDS